MGGMEGNAIIWIFEMGAGNLRDSGKQGLVPRIDTKRVPGLCVQFYLDLNTQLPSRVAPGSRPVRFRLDWRRAVLPRRRTWPACEGA